MKIKKHLGAFTLMLAAMVVSVGAASFFTVGAEEMPESIKNLR
jgi:hypothetical protein